VLGRDYRVLIADSRVLFWWTAAVFLSRTFTGTMHFSENPTKSAPRLSAVRFRDPDSGQSAYERTALQL